MVASDEASVAIYRAWLALPLSSRPRLASPDGTPDRRHVALSDGRLRHASARNHPDLFLPARNPPIRIPQMPAQAPSSATSALDGHARDHSSAWVNDLLLARFRGGIEDVLVHGISCCPDLAELLLDSARLPASLPSSQWATLSSLTALLPDQRVFAVVAADQTTALLSALTIWNLADATGDLLIIAPVDVWQTVQGV